jgi:hypothetical protein
MKRALLFIVLAALPLQAWGDSPSSSSATPFVESTWPGIEFHIPEVKRIAGNHLLVVVALWASAKAPSSTLIGTPGAYPPNPTKEELTMPLIPTPFSLQGSTMIEDRTQQKYEMVPSAPKAPFYRPSSMLASISPRQTLYMTIQFLAPPPPPPDKNGIVPKQTVSILLPEAEGPVTKVVIPPPVLTSPSQ